MFFHLQAALSLAGCNTPPKHVVYSLVLSLWAIATKSMKAAATINFYGTLTCSAVGDWEDQNCVATVLLRWLQWLTREFAVSEACTNVKWYR